MFHISGDELYRTKAVGWRGAIVLRQFVLLLLTNRKLVFFQTRNFYVKEFKSLLFEL